MVSKPLDGKLPQIAKNISCNLLTAGRVKLSIGAIHFSVEYYG